MDERVQVQLSAEASLVLFEMLSRYSDTDILAIEDQAEQRVLWSGEAVGRSLCF